MILSSDFHQAEICDTKNNVLASGNLCSENGNTIEIRGEFFPIFNKGDKLKIINKQEDRTAVYITYVYISSESYLSLFVINKSTESNERDFFRVETKIHTKINYEIIDGIATQLQQSFDICILNLSLSGIRFSTTANLKIKSIYKSVLSLDKNMIEFVFKIVRIIEHEDDIYEFGCQIIYISPSNEKCLCNYLFLKESQNRAAIKDILER